MKTGTELIAEERKRQIEKEGYSSEHDDKHDDQSLLLASLCYIEYETFNPNEDRQNGSPWPWNDECFKPSTPIRNLVKAGALIAAEIDRIQRLKK